MKANFKVFDEKNLPFSVRMSELKLEMLIMKVSHEIASGCVSLYGEKRRSSSPQTVTQSLQLLPTPLFLVVVFPPLLAS